MFLILAKLCLSEPIAVDKLFAALSVEGTFLNLGAQTNIPGFRYIQRLQIRMFMYWSSLSQLTCLFPREQLAFYVSYTG